MIQYLILLIIIIFMNQDHKIYEGFDGCEIHYNNRLQKIFENNDQSYPMRGYTGNEYLYKMEFMDSDEPIPMNANFFLGKY